MALGLRLGDPDDQVLGAWLAKEYLRDVYLTDDPNEAAVLLDRVIAGCLADKVDEIVSLGNTLKRWRTQILAHHLTGASNGPTEAMNLLVKKIKRCGHGFKSFRNYRLRVLLHCGGIQWRGCCTNTWHRDQGRRASGRDPPAVRLLDLSISSPRVGAGCELR